ncbi:MAG: hypothetical protein PVJ84_19075 [Desulfobacteraceae bacterium]|jgi:hypothetical protein
MEKTVRKFLNMNFKKNTSKKIPTGRKQIYSAGSKAVSERRWHHSMKAIFFDLNLGRLEEPDKGLAKTMRFDWKSRHPAK